MKTYKQIFLQTNKDKKPDTNLPDYKMSVLNGDDFIEIGAGWKKIGKTGAPFVSLSLANAYDKENQPLTYQNKNGDTIQRKGYIILDEKEYRELLKKITKETGEAYLENLSF